MTAMKGEKNLKTERPIKVWRMVKGWLAVRICWRHGPIPDEAAERIDRIRNPKKYLDQVNAAESHDSQP